MGQKAICALGPAKTQISLGILPVWSVLINSLGPLSFPHTYSEDWSDRVNAHADLILQWTQILN